jgi:hypothetical protein
MVRAHVEKITAGSEPLGQGDVLRLRFWLMLLLQKARQRTSSSRTSLSEQGETS